MPKHTRIKIEEWRDIPGWKGYYQASSHGRVRSLDRTIQDKNGRSVRVRGRILSPGTKAAGYHYVNLRRGGSGSSQNVHTLVARTFLGERPEGKIVCHTNGNPRDNRVDNLRYATYTDNLVDAIGHGTHHGAKKTHCKRGHEMAEPNLVPSKKKHGMVAPWRGCLACSRAHNWVSRHPEERADYQSISDAYYEAIMGGA